MSDASGDVILVTLCEILRDFHGREYGGSMGRETRFFGDLGLASIDAVVLGETLETRFGRKLPFGVLFAELGKRTNRDLMLGELADFLARNLNDSPPLA